MIRLYDLCALLVVMLVFPMVSAEVCNAQLLGPSSFEDEDDDGGFAVRDGDIGYIDSAVVGNNIRLRYDAGYDFRRPSRAEFFYAPAQPLGPGLPQPEVSVDYQDFQLYVERQATEDFSLFLELGARSLNPIVNDNTSGLGDLNCGFKYRLLETECSLTTAQLRVYAPSGDVDRGLSTGHASIEPSILFMRRHGQNWTSSGEIRYWTAVDGSVFAGDLVRYGLGLQYQPDDWCYIQPVAEVVGWTVLNGRQSSLATPGGGVVVEDADGDTILNAKIGARIFLTSETDLYLGYGRVLTGDSWYDNTLRAELRFAF